jgi:hypothetical protein
VGNSATLARQCEPLLVKADGSMISLWRARWVPKRRHWRRSARCDEMGGRQRWDEASASWRQLNCQWPTRSWLTRPSAGAEGVWLHRIQKTPLQQVQFGPAIPHPLEQFEPGDLPFHWSMGLKDMVKSKPQVNTLSIRQLLRQCQRLQVNSSE